MKLNTNMKNGSTYRYTVIRLLILIHPIISSFFCLSKFQLLIYLSPQIAK